MVRCIHVTQRAQCCIPVDNSVPHTLHLPGFASMVRADRSASKAAIRLGASRNAPDAVQVAELIRKHLAIALVSGRSLGEAVVVHVDA